MENFAEGELGEQQKRQDAARSQALISVANRVIGKDPLTGALSGGKTGDKDYGKVKVWNLNEKKYVTVHPIDAAEMLAGGGVVLDKPENEPEAE